MKKALVISILCLLGRTAFADDLEMTAFHLGQALDVWNKQADGTWTVDKRQVLDPNRCVELLATLTSAKAPDSLTFSISNGTPTLKAGTYPWSKGRDACAKIGGYFKHDEILGNFSRWANLSKREMRDKQGPKNKEYFANCLSAYDDAIKAGLPPTEMVKDYDLNATMQDLKKQWCEPGNAKLEEAEAARAAPFKKVLKNDKLRIALRDLAYITLLGGGEPTPAHLAKINVWFESAKPSKVCPNGAQVNVLHRYQFDAQQKLTKATDKEFCGTPPKSAYK